MNLDLHTNKDVLAGLLFMVLGALAVASAADYPMGATAQMGPGYFPMVLGGILLLFGLCVLRRGIRAGEPVQGQWGWRPLGWIAFSILLFGFLLERVGMVLTIVATVFVAAAAGREFRFKEVLVLAVLMTVFCVGVFSYGLRLPLRLFGGF
jgi:putative tricarboxylic transport membrane protein